MLIKDLRLAVSPLTWVFLLFAAMTMIPGYPILMGAFFVCLGIFYSFQGIREQNDILFSVLLPVAKGDVVRGKFRLVCLFQAIAFVLMALLTALRMTALKGAPVYAANVMMPADPVFLGFALLLFAAFNSLFLGGFFKTAYAIGRPFLVFAAAAILITGVGEALHHIPPLRFLTASAAGAADLRWAVLAAGAVVYALVTRLSMTRSIRRFEALDL